MNVLFISLLDFQSIDERGIYTDLLKEIRGEGHKVYIVSPSERRAGRPSAVIQDGSIRISKPRIGNIQRTNVIEKGISTIMLGSDLRRAVKRDFSDVRFDLVLYPTPPITFLDAVEYVKRRDDATTYLMLKDIFPQNAVDIGMMTTHGPKGILYRHFRRQEKKLYSVSDYIGCMSQANVDYLLAHNSDLNPKRMGICPNSVIPTDMSCDAETRDRLRAKYDIPQNKKVFVYGGNLGRPQDIPFLIECIRSQEANDQAFFLIVGNGTEYGKLEAFFSSERPTNAKLMQRLPKEDYDALVGSCDVGLVLLDHRFTIPNFPSRILSYMQAKVPVLCATDSNTDVGKISEDGGFGVSCLSASVESFASAINRLLDSDLQAMGLAGWHYLQDHYDARDTAESILETVEALRSVR